MASDAGEQLLAAVGDSGDPGIGQIFELNHDKSDSLSFPHRRWSDGDIHSIIQTWRQARALADHSFICGNDDFLHRGNAGHGIEAHPRHGTADLSDLLLIDAEANALADSVASGCIARLPAQIGRIISVNPNIDFDVVLFEDSHPWYVFVGKESVVYEGHFISMESNYICEVA